MIRCKLAIVALFLGGVAFAAPKVEQQVRYNFDRRDNTTTNDDGLSAMLEPVIPPGINTGNITILAPAKAITLAWAGSTHGTAARRLARRNGSAPPIYRRDGAVTSQAAFTFQFPTITLDHSTFVSSIACPAVGTLTGVLTSAAAYTYAKARWPSAGNILFVTSVDGCGLNDQNHLFLSTSVTFNDKTKSFTAKGAPSTYKATGVHMNLQWGVVPIARKIRRAADKREMFESHELHRRRVSLGISWDLTMSRFANAEQFSPWDDAIMLFKWGKDGGREDSSWSKGENASPGGHHKRSSNTTSLGHTRSLNQRETTSKYDYGLALYCVDCGFTGGAEVWGEVDVSFIPFGLKTARAGFDAHFAFDLNLGLAAYVVYKKTWTKMLEHLPLAGFDIPLICDIGLFVELDIEAEIEISATGTLLLGAGIHYDNIGFVIDFLDSSNSKSTTLPPRFQHRAEATGQLKVGASLGMPIKLGLGVQVLEGLWDADAAIVDTPSLNIEGEFVLSATVTDDGKIVTDINGGCYGIAWNIFFQNLIQLELQAKYITDYTIDLVRPFKSDPIAEGCIGFVKDGSEGEDLTPTGNNGNGLFGNQPGGVPVSPKATTTGASPASTSGCRPNQIVDNFVAAAKAGAVCKKITTSATVANSNNVGKGQIVTDVNTCADSCLREPKCLSWSLSNKGVGGLGTCQMYTKKVSSIPIITKDSTTLTFYDQSCWMYSKCKT